MSGCARAAAWHASQMGVQGVGEAGASLDSLRMSTSTGLKGAVREQCQTVKQ